MIAIIILIGQKLDYQDNNSWQDSIVIQKTEPVALYINESILKFAKDKIDKAISKKGEKDEDTSSSDEENIEEPNLTD